MLYPVLIFQFLSQVILLKSTIYFRVVTKKYYFPLSGGHVVKYGNIVSKVFDMFSCNNKNQIMIIKLRMLYRQFRKKSIVS